MKAIRFIFILFLLSLLTNAGLSQINTKVRHSGRFSTVHIYEYDINKLENKLPLSQIGTLSKFDEADFSGMVDRYVIINHKGVTGLVFKSHVQSDAIEEFERKVIDAAKDESFRIFSSTHQAYDTWEDARHKQFDLVKVFDDSESRIVGKDARIQLIGNHNDTVFFVYDGIIFKSNAKNIDSPIANRLHAEAVEKENARIAEMKRVAQEEEKEKKEKKQIAEKETYEENIIKYGKKTADAIRSRKVFIGMGSKEVLLSWGRPQSINRTTTSELTTEQWVYGDGEYLYMRDGILETISTRDQ